MTMNTSGLRGITTLLSRIHTSTCFLLKCGQVLLMIDWLAFTSFQMFCQTYTATSMIIGSCRIEIQLTFLPRTETSWTYHTMYWTWGLCGLTFTLSRSKPPRLLEGAHENIGIWLSSGEHGRSTSDHLCCSRQETISEIFDRVRQSFINWC